jgi:ADP-heptose:LPS heptosyltransferase
MARPSNLSMHALQRADQRLGALACLALQPVRWLRPLGRLVPRGARRGRVLCIKFWGIGSLQLLTPAIRTLRWRHPEAELVLLTLAPNREAALALGVFDRVLTLDVERAGWSRVFARILALTAELRREHFDEVYDFEFFTRFSSLVALATGSLSTHGFAHSSIWRGGFHHRTVPFNRYWHVARNFRVLAGGEDGEPVRTEELAPLRFDEADERNVAALLAEQGLAPGAGYCVLNPNAGSLSLERRWPPPSFAELATRLSRHDGLAVVLIGSSGEAAYTEQVRALSAAAPGAPIVQLAGRLSVGELAALLARALGVVSNDSGPMHLAAALGAPTIGLFGPETPVMYAPLGREVRALYRPTPCSPCINVHDNKVASCIYGRPECLVNITVDEVHEVLRELIGGGERPVVLRPLPPPAVERVAPALPVREGRA